MVLERPNVVKEVKELPNFFVSGFCVITTEPLRRKISALPQPTLLAKTDTEEVTNLHSASLSKEHNAPRALRSRFGSDADLSTGGESPQVTHYLEATHFGATMGDIPRGGALRVTVSGGDVPRGDVPRDGATHRGDISRCGAAP